MRDASIGSRTRSVTWLVSASLVFASVPANCQADEPGQDRPSKLVTWPGITPTGSVLLPNGWSLKPAGRQTQLGDFPVQIALHPRENVLAILHAGYGEHEVVTVDARSSKVIGRVVLPQSFAGLSWSRDGKRLFVGGGFDDVVYGFDHAAGLLTNRVEFTFPAPLAGRKEVARVPAGVAISSDDQILWVANAFGHTLARFDVASRRLQSELALGADSYPYGLALDDASARVFVSLWGSAKVAVVNTADNRLAGVYDTLEHPNEMLLARGGATLYVANANRNAVSVFDTKRGVAIETINTAIDPKAPPGSTPMSLALSPDESMLFVVNANTNNVAAFNVKDAGHSTPLGFIPVGWYPTSVRVARDGSTIWVSNGKGASSQANRDGPNPTIPAGAEKTRQYIAGLFRGTLSTIPMPTPSRMAVYSKTVYECSPIRKGNPTAVVGPPAPSNSPVPQDIAVASPIKYCVYIIKENRTYDQIFGDLPQGNGEPALCLFPEKVTPNHHALAREFVLLDNFYVESEVSADGHEWTMGAYATDFVERTWPIGYRGEKKTPYPAEGNKQVFSIARPAGGYLWDRALAKGVSYRSYGEYVQNGPTRNDPAFTNVESLKGHFDPKFRGYDLDYPDAKRADRFLEELSEFNKSGEMPRLVMLRLPNDHTSGTRVGKPTPIAYVADNDLALGRVVEGLSKSRFWPQMAIFVVEDDAQNGSDHVDAHRTVALVASPYAKRGFVDSTMYSTSSMLRTIELILGLEPMSQFDASARPMYASFTDRADTSTYTVKPAQVDLGAVNLAGAWGSAESKKLNLEKEDQADDLLFNEIIWRAVKGANSPMPPPVHAAFVLPRQHDGDDDDDD